MKEKSTFETLGDRMKNYEKQYEQSISTDENIVIRIDGHKFSKYTKGFKRPFDEILSKAMEQTTKDLVQEFQAVVGYTQSDEITLVIPSPKPKKEHYNKLPSQDLKHAYNGRIQKMASLASGFATMAFNKNLEELSLDFYQRKILCFSAKKEDYEYNDMMETKIFKAWFDARVYSVPNDIEAFNSVLWRYHDCIKNSKSMVAQTYCSHKSLNKKSGEEQIRFCLETTGEDYNNIEERYKSGIFIKKEKYMKDTEHGMIERGRIISITKKDFKYSKENVEFIMTKFI